MKYFCELKADGNLYGRGKCSKNEVYPGFTVIESFAFGKPVIGANIGGISELIENRYTGILFRSGDKWDLEDKIRYLVNNKDIVLELGKNARNIVEKEYDPDLHYERLMKVYEQIKA